MFKILKRSIRRVMVNNAKWKWNKKYERIIYIIWYWTWILRSNEKVRF